MPFASEGQDSLYQGWYERIELALSASHEGIYDWDIARDEIFYMPTVLETLGLDRGERDKAEWMTSPQKPNLFTDIGEVIHAEDREWFRTEIERYLMGHSDLPLRLELRVSHPGGAWRWIRLSGKVMRGARGEAIRMLGNIVDVTRRKIVESRLNDERQLFHLLMDHIPDNVYFKNRESRFVVANSATARKLGVQTPSDLVGHTDADFFDAESALDNRREEQSIMESGQGRLSNLREELWPDGSTTWCVTSKVPWYGQGGQLKGVMGVTTDVTALMKVRRELERTAKELELRNVALEKEISLAREVQLAMIPQEIREIACQGVEYDAEVKFAREYRPGDGGVAGDWFEVFPVGSQAVGMLICDVMGHGVRSALIAAVIRGLIEEKTIAKDMPSRFLQELNDGLSRILSKAGITLFASAFYLYLDLENGIAKYASAGHPGAIWMDHEGNVKQLVPPRGMAMGLMEGVAYRDDFVEIGPSGSFLLFTDGLIEAANSAGEELGSERLMEEIGKARPEGARRLVRLALKAGQGFMGQHDFEDDLTLLGASYARTRREMVESDFAF